MTAAVVGMVAGDHDRPDAGAPARARPRLAPRRAADRSCRRGPANTRSCSMLVVERRRPSSALVGQRRGRRRPSVRSASPASSSFASQDLRAALRASAAARSSPTSSCVQRASSTSGAPFVKTQHALRRARRRVWTVLISLRSDENGTSPTRAKRASSASGLEPGLARRHEQRAFGRDRPGRSSARPARCSDGVVRAVGDGERALQFGAQRRRRPGRRRRAAPRPRARSRCRSKSTRPLAVTTTRTVISFFVSVPVLSDAMTVAEPSVSTAARWRTMALRLAMRCTPSDSTAVTTAGSPSGTAATASATPRISTSKSAADAADVLDERRSSRSSRPRWRRRRRRAACRRGRAPSGAASVSVGASLQQPGDAPHLGLHARSR